MIATELIAWDGPVLLCRLTFTVAGFYQSADPVTLAIQVRRGDKIAVQESFDADDLDGARARFAELVAAESVSTDSVELGPLTSAAWVAVRSLDALDDVTGRHELVAVRTEEFCLTRFTGSTAAGEEIERLVVSSVIDGVVERSITFGSDDLASALERFDEMSTSR